MKQYTLILADSSEDFRQALQLQFEPFCRVFCCSTGGELLNLMGKVQPDVLLLDLMLPEIDGFSVLSALQALGDLPGILAVSSYMSPYVEEMAEKLGVSFLLERPCSLQSVREQIRRLMEARKSVSSEDRFMRASGQLLRLGFSAKLRGYGYLRDAVLLFSENPNQSILKELYPAVAGSYGVSSEDVEHSIRSAAAKAWSRRTKPYWMEYFPAESGRPSNACLIQVLAESLRDEPEALAFQML